MIYILYGEDETRMEYKLETIRKREQVEMSVRYDCSKDSISSVLEEMDVQTLFDLEKKMIIVQNCLILSTSTQAKAKNPGCEADALALRDPEEKVVVYMVPAAKLDTRKKAVKKLMEKAAVIECQPLDVKSRKAFVKEVLQEKGMSMDNAALEEFCSRVGFDCLVIDHELDKLQINSNRPDLEMVRQLTSAAEDTNVFRLTDALFAKNAPALIDAYRDFRRQGMQPNQIVALCASQVRFLYQVRILMDQGLSNQEMASQLKTSSGRIYHSVMKASQFTSDELLSHLGTLADIDYNQKAGLMDPDTGFESMALNILFDQQGYRERIHSRSR